jgi:hypothetical protein
MCEYIGSEIGKVPAPFCGGNRSSGAPESGCTDPALRFSPFLYFALLSCLAQYVAN